MKTNPDDPAHSVNTTVRFLDGRKQAMAYSGLTKLEDFTKAAMQGLCPIISLSPTEIADEALKIALATIDALNKHQEDK